MDEDASNIRHIKSTYCFESAPNSEGQLRRVPSDYMLNTGLNERELEQDFKPVEPARQRSVFFNKDLNDPEEQKENAEKVLVPSQEIAGYPVNGAHIKKICSQLDDVLYKPTLIDGLLFFVSNDGAKVNASDKIEGSTREKIQSEITNNSSSSLLSFETLERHLPAASLKLLAKGLKDDVSSGRITLNERDAAALAQLAEGPGPSQSTTTAPYLETERGLRTAESSSRRSFQTYSGTEQDVSTAVWNTERSSSVRTARNASSPSMAYRRTTTRTNDDLGSLKTGRQTSLSPAPRTARSPGSSSVRTGRQLSQSPAPKTARNVTSSMKTARQQSLSPVPRTAINRSASLRTGRQQSHSPAPRTALGSNEASLKTARQLSRSPSPQTARDATSPSTSAPHLRGTSPYPRTTQYTDTLIERTARQQSFSPAPRTARNVNSQIERTARQSSFSPLPRTARNVNSQIERTARQSSLSPLPRTARNVNSQLEMTARQQSLSPMPLTARHIHSPMERNAYRRNPSPFRGTNRASDSSSQRTARQQSLSPAPRTAHSPGYLSSSQRTARQLTLSPSPQTARSSRSTRRASGFSPMHTARARTVTPINTARSLSTSNADSVSTARSTPSTEANTARSVASSTVTADIPDVPARMICEIAPVYAEVTIHGLVPAHLLQTSSNPRAAATTNDAR